jgi:succinate dehydrogenase/fumarate reductase flavoprotein subunit
LKKENQVEKLEIIEHECDVCVVGGGLAGCMAAIRAGELNDNVILVDKSNPERSGCAASGIDHIWAYFPEVQKAEGVSLEDLVEEHVTRVAKGLINKDIIYYIADTSLDRILDLESYGMKVRYEDSSLPGNFRLQFQLHSCRNTLHFDGRDVKRFLTRQVRKTGVKILDRVMGTELLTKDGQIAGAIGYGTRDGKLHVIRAKAVIMAAGRPNRLYKPFTGLVFNTRMPPALTADGKSAMFRAGVDLINMEFVSIPGRWSSKNLIRGGGLPGGSYQPPGIGLNGLDEVIKPRNHDMEDWQGVSTSFGTNKTFMGELKAGRGPIYADMSWGSDEDQAYMRWAIAHEGSGSAFHHLNEQYGIDFRKHKIEIWPLEPEHSGAAGGGPIVDRNCQTTMAGLYAAGDEAGGIPQSVVPGALTMGYLAAESAVAYADGIKQMPDAPISEDLLDFCYGIINRDEGDSWQDAQAFIQNVMTDYNIQYRSGTMAQRGLENLDYLEKTMQLTANNPHEMTHCLEMRNLIECGQIIFRSTIERRESRYNVFSRLDYPDRDDDNFFCFLGQRREANKIIYSRYKP